ncbi:MAG: glucose-6-phosphate isomerase [Verrucomicrobiota bacterium]|nr:glucose-6-phosphate isomerase [Verrucomicrobiota bacterium]
MNKKYCDPKSEITLDLTGMISLPNSFNDAQSMPNMKQIHEEMKKIEAGLIKNPDENRKVTHFTDRKNYLASELYKEVEGFAASLRDGEILSSTKIPFQNLVVNGIGGSALGPQLLQFAINGPYWNEFDAQKRNNNLKIYFTDNTDSAGISDILSVTNPEETLVLSVSKSGGTQETRNNMLAFENFFKKKGIDFTKHAAAVTMKGSKLDIYATDNNWLKVFHMPASIGGRTSETAVVGHVPAALAGIDFGDFIKGACQMDELTRNSQILENPAYLLSLSWYYAGNGKGDKNMVIVPYSDRLILFARYLQQLVMESLGKEYDLDGNRVCQGLNVFGNKGGTDAHAFIQQLNDGKNDFFATFIEVLKDAEEILYEDGFSMGDYLHGFKTGLVNALENGKREVIEITIREVNEFYLGALIALYERAVAAYAEMINVNAFHQPGVESYKKASEEVNHINIELRKFIEANPDFSGTAADYAKEAFDNKNTKEIEGILRKFAANNRKIGNVILSCQWENDAWMFLTEK